VGRNLLKINKKSSTVLKKKKKKIEKKDGKNNINWKIGKRNYFREVRAKKVRCKMNQQQNG